MNYSDLQDKHVELLKLNQKGKLSTEDVLSFIELSKKSGRKIEDSEERHYLRTLLRYWGFYIYDKLGYLPNLALEPNLFKK